MTRSEVDLYDAIRCYSVELKYLNGHEAKSLLTRLSRYGVILDEHYTWSTDSKNRPVRRHARYTVIVPCGKNQSFTAMMTQTKKHLGSTLTYHRLP